MHVIVESDSSIYGEVDGDYLAMDQRAGEGLAWLDDVAREPGDHPVGEILLREEKSSKNLERRNRRASAPLSWEPRPHGLVHLLVGA
jgi:hypothetical protein